MDAFGFLERHEVDALQLCGRRFKALIERHPQSLPLRVLALVDYYPHWRYFYIKTACGGSNRLRNAPLQMLVDAFRNCSITHLAISGRFRRGDPFIQALSSLRGAVLVKSLALDPARFTMATNRRHKGYIRNYNFHRALDRIVDVLPGLRVIWMECNSLPPKRLDDSFLQRCRARGIHELRNVGGVTEVTEQGIMDFIFARPSINLMIHLDMTYRRASRDLLRNLIEGGFEGRGDWGTRHKEHPDAYAEFEGTFPHYISLLDRLPLDVRGNTGTSDNLAKALIIAHLAISGRFRDSDRFISTLSDLRGAVIVRSLALDPAPITLATRGRFKGSISDDHYHQAFDRLVELLPALRAIRLERNTLPPKRIEDSFLQRCRTHGICELRSGICQVRDAGSVTEQGIMDFIFDRPSLDEMTFLAATCSQVSRDFVKNLIQRCEESPCGQDETTRETAGIALQLVAEGLSEQVLGPQYEKYTSYSTCLRFIPRWHIDTEGEPRVVAVLLGPALLF
ncbi:hypothetical protein AAVH_24548, partial [Aphelenchoides avenae]